MGNHYHLLVETPKANLAKGMRQLNGVYAQSFNRRHGRDGHLFQGRYGARLVQADEHLLGVVRYIVRNPLRAGICTRLDDWPWSSHAATIGKRPPGFLTSERLLSFLGESRSSARASYLALVTRAVGATLAALALGPGAPRAPAMDAAALDTRTTLRWKPFKSFNAAVICAGLAVAR